MSNGDQPAVTIDFCTERHQNLEDKLNNTQKRQDKLEDKFDSIKGYFIAILVALLINFGTMIAKMSTS